MDAYEVTVKFLIIGKNDRDAEQGVRKIFRIDNEHAEYHGEPVGAQFAGTVKKEG